MGRFASDPEDKGEADPLVIWVPDESLRALDPSNDHGAKQILQSLVEWDPTAWGLEEFGPEEVPVPSA